MKNEIENVIKEIAAKAKDAPSHEALHLTQAALNLMHVLQIQSQLKTP